MADSLLCPPRWLAAKDIDSVATAVARDALMGSQAGGPVS